MFKPKTVDGLMAQFKKLHADLMGVAEKATKDAEDIQVSINALAERREGAMVERERALEAAQKIEGFLV